jgi:hypothetical protein
MIASLLMSLVNIVYVVIEANIYYSMADRDLLDIKRLLNQLAV